MIHKMPPGFKGFQNGHKINVGIPRSEETKRKIRNKQIGIPKSEERRKKLEKINSKRCKDKTYEEIYGNERAKEIKDKIGKKCKGKTCPYKNIGKEEFKKRVSESRQNGPPSLKKNKTYEEIYGKEKAKEIKELNSKSSKAFFKTEKGKIARNKIREARAKQIFPVKDTKIEVKLQNLLKELNINFKTHEYINDIKHSYQCDIYIPSKKLVIEADGEYWHNYPYGLEKDHIRTKELKEAGYEILRFWETEINKLTLDDFEERIEVF